MYVCKALGLDASIDSCIMDEKRQQTERCGAFPCPWDSRASEPQIDDLCQTLILMTTIASHPRFSTCSTLCEWRPPGIKIAVICRDFGPSCTQSVAEFHREKTSDDPTEGIRDLMSSLLMYLLLYIGER